MNLPAQLLSAVCVAGVAAVVGEPSTPPIDTSAAATLLGLIERFGVMAVLLVYFVVRDFIRYRADQREKQESRDDIKRLYGEIKDLNNEISGDHKIAMAKQHSHIERARRTHDMLIVALEDFEPTAQGTKLLKAQEAPTEALNRK